MKYKDIIFGLFCKRINRFVAEVLIDNRVEVVHVKNTGRLKELLVTGAEVSLEPSQNPSRKTNYSLIAVKLNGSWINIDSQIPNAVVYEGLLKGKVAELGIPNTVRREVPFRKSRFDLFFEDEKESGFIEVKGVTLEKNGIAMFPDAPTTRGTKHVMELIDAVEKGYKGVIFFLIQMEGCKIFTPNHELDYTFTQSLKEAKQRGVQILAYNSFVTENEIVMNEPLNISF